MTFPSSHHSPSPLSLPPLRCVDPSAPAYATDLSSLLASAPYKPDLWIHGHTHHCADYMLGETRVVSNQRGYQEGGKFVEGWDDGKVVEI